MAKLTNKQLEEQARKYKRIQLLEARLKQEKAKLGDSLKKEMARRKKSELLIGDYKISYNETVSQRFDTQRFKEEKPSVYNKFLYDVESKSIYVHLGK